MEIPVARIRPFLTSKGPAWSEDGEIALISTPNVTVYTPLDYIPEKKLTWDRVELPEPDSYPLNRQIVSQSSISQVDSAPAQTVQVGWSPTGLTQWKGCFLTQLTHKFQLIILANAGKNHATSWVSQPPLTHIQDMRITCFDWTRAQDDSLWGAALFVVGTEDEGIHIYNVHDNQFDYIRAYPVQGCTDIRVSSGYVYAITGTNVVEINLSEPDAEVVAWPLGPGHVSYVHADKDGLMVAQPGRVTHYPSNSVTNLEFSDAVVGILGSCQEWAAVSSRGNVHSAGFPADYLRRHLTQKRESSLVVVHGAVSSTDGTAYALGYSTRPRNALVYPSVQNKKMTLSLRSIKRPQILNMTGAPRSAWVAAYLADPGTSFEPPILATQTDLDIDRGGIDALLRSSSLRSLQLQTYFHVADHTSTIRRAIAKILLSTAPKDSLSPIDRVIMANYGHFYDIKPDPVGTLEISGGLFNEKFDFAANTTDWDKIESLSKHNWKRCALTMIPVLSMDTLASTNNQFSILTEKSNELSGSILAPQLVNIPVCIFNGCQLYQRV